MLTYSSIKFIGVLLFILYVVLYVHTSTIEFLNPKYQMSVSGVGEYSCMRQ
jgi:hypothetical protein